jgi:hypothetical protein
MVDDLNRHQTWPPPLLKKENLRNISIKKILKNPEKGQLLSDFRKMIHLRLPFRIMVDSFSHHQTWPPPLLKMQKLYKKACKFC